MMCTIERYKDLMLCMGSKGGNQFVRIGIPMIFFQF